MAGATGLEPATFGVTGRHSNQLSYAPAYGLVNGAKRERGPMYGSPPTLSSKSSLFVDYWLPGGFPPGFPPP